MIKLDVNLLKARILMTADEQVG